MLGPPRRLASSVAGMEPAWERSGPAEDSLNTHRFSTDRLTIELPVADDAAELYRLIGGQDREAICATLVWDGPDDPADSAWWVEQCRTATYGDWGYHWVVRDRGGDLAGTPGRPIGAIGTRPSGVPGRADVGYWFGRAYWGRGVATEALTALVDLGRNELGYAKIEANVFAHNVAGRRLVERVGFEREGLIRRGHRKRGRWVDNVIYGLVI